MTQEASIVEGLTAIEGIGARENVQPKPGSAFFRSSILIQHGSGYQYPLDTFVRQITIQETINQEGILGFLDMVDTYNLIRNGIILGQELLYLKFCTSGAEEAGLEKDWTVDFYKHPLHIYKVEDIKERDTSEGTEAAGTLSYRLHFCSPELIINDRIRVSKTIQGTYTDMVIDILTNHLKTKKQFLYEITNDLKKLIIPNLHPMELIKRITSSAQMEVVQKQAGPPGRHGTVATVPVVFNGRLTDFHFWETTRGYNFLPMIRPEADSQFTLTVGNSPTSAPYKLTMLSSLNHEYMFHGDTYGTIKSGMWAGKHIQHNAYSKSVKTYQSNYHRSIGNERYSHVSKTPNYLNQEFGKNRDEEDRMISDWPEGKLFFNSFGGTQKNTNINKKNREADTPWSPTPATTDLRRSMQLAHSVRYDQLSVTTHGISSLEAGMVVKLDLPNIGEGSGYFKGSDAKWENRLDNVWIITSLKHFITLPDNTYRCELILSNTMTATTDVLPIYEAPGELGPQPYT